MTIDRVANVITIVTGLMLSGYIVQQVTRPVPTAPPGVFTYSVGDRMEAAQVFEFSKSRLTLIMALRSTCRFCNESMPFYQKLPAVRPRLDGVRLLTVSEEPDGVFRSYLTDHKLALDHAAALPLADMKIVVTPTLLAVDSQGIVRGSWVGKLTPEKEQQVVRMVTAAR